ncbi:hypothetical protein JCM15765_14530 [Paradesulfitobacterium aromaticivorans]
MTEELETNRKYWLVRTFGGKYYSHFVQNGYIAIGWNELSDIEMIKKADKDSVAKEQLLNKAKELYAKKENEQLGRIVNPIIKFVTEMNIGDVVVIPNENSKEIHFGIIKSEVKIVKDVINLDEGLEPLYKQRTVEWVTWRDKDSVDLGIFKMLSSHYAISSADDYAESIDRTMYSFYVKGDRAHLVIKVGKKGEYTGTEIPDLINLFLGTIDLYNEVSGKSVSKSDVKMKISLQSEGFVLFSGNETTITLILAMAVALCGGGLKFKRSAAKKDKSTETGAEVETSGLIPTIWDRVLTTRDQNHRHKLEEKEQNFRHMVESLNITLPSFGELDENAATEDKLVE